MKLFVAVVLLSISPILGFEQRLLSDGRTLLHTHLQSSPMYGNSTDLQYFFVDVFVGSLQQRQALIVDTGSGVMAFPCQNHCQSCGTHINKYFDVDASTSKYVYQCDQSNNNEEGCAFSQAYGEGSSYSGFLARDEMYFGEAYHASLDAFNFTFGCVTTETKLFYT